MTEYTYALLSLTALVTVLVALVTFLSLRVRAAVRDARTQRQEMDARTFASEHLRRQIVDSLTAGLLVVGRDGLVEILNPTARRLLGVDYEPVGARYRSLLAAAQPLADVIDECLSTDRPILRRSIRLPGSGRPSHLGVSVSPLAGAAGSAGVICLFSDLTTVVELEEQLRLKEALARVGELTAGIAHEFRNGLATIHGYSRLLDLQKLAPPERPYLEGIRQETEALGRVVTNFLNFARPEQVVFARVDLGSVARRAGDEIRHDLPQGSTIDSTGEFAEIQGDEVLLRQVFSNLLRNAVEACQEAGITPSLVIDGEVDAARRTCRIAIDDNGPGIPEAARSRVFTPFFTTRPRGTGLGLAIVQKIVVTHNGRITIGTSTSGGASVRMSFPTSQGLP